MVFASPRRPQGALECGSLLPLSSEPVKNRHIGLLEKAAASCRTPKAPCGREHYAAFAETAALPGS